MSKNHYVDKKKFHQAFVDWNKELKINPEAPLPDFIGECFILMAENIARGYRFNQYSWLDDSKGNAILNCVKYAKSYKPDESAEAFSYFTQAIKNIFFQTNNKNKRENDKIDMYKNSNIQLYQTNDNDHDIVVTGIDDLRNFNDILALERDRCNNLSDYDNGEVQSDETIDDILSKEINNFNRDDVINDENTTLEPNQED